MRPHANALIVEDNRHMRVMLTHLLQTLRVEFVDAVSTIADARARLDLLAYDFALVDVGLENEENGLELIRQVRLDPNHPSRRMPMIVVSGQNQRNVITAARDAGADHFLMKPVSTAALRTRVMQVLEHPPPYIESATYFGPDRRQSSSRHYDGPERRRSEWLI
jgi:CheY-like chemotaxis protein